MSSPTTIVDQAAPPAPSGGKSFAPARRHAGRFISPLVFAALIGLWYAAAHVFGVRRFILPAPDDVWMSLYRGFAVSPTDPSGFWRHIGVTFSEAFLGFVFGSVAGIVLGVCVARWKLVEQILYPYIVALQSMPKVALAPLVIIWFGFDMTGKVVVTSVITFFPLLVNTMSGYWAVDRDRVDFARSCNASEWQILTKIILPSALPSIFVGLNVACVLAYLGALVGEFVGAQAGLGMLLMQYNQSMQIAPVFAVLIVLGLLGYLSSACIRFFETRICKWARRTAPSERF